MNGRKLNGKFVMIGDYIANEMEYVSEDESKIYEENGKLYASVTGRLKVDPRKRTITIVSAAEEKNPVLKRGDIIIGRVEHVRKFTVGIQIFEVKGKLLIQKGYYGNIHVSNVANTFIEEIKDVFKKTDFVRAKILGMRGQEYELGTKGPALGVISADCPICGTNMTRIGRDMLQCPFCGKRERRKLAADYGDVNEIIRF